MIVPRPPSEAAQRLAYLTRLRDHALTLTQEQLDSVCWVTVGITGAHHDGWTPQALAEAYAPYIARIAEVVERERLLEAQTMEDLYRLREGVGQ